MRTRCRNGAAGGSGRLNRQVTQRRNQYSGSAGQEKRGEHRYDPNSAGPSKTSGYYLPTYFASFLVHDWSPFPVLVVSEFRSLRNRRGKAKLGASPWSTVRTAASLQTDQLRGNCLCEWVGRESKHGF